MHVCHVLSLAISCLWSLYAKCQTKAKETRLLTSLLGDSDIFQTPIYKQYIYIYYILFNSTPIVPPLAFFGGWAAFSACFFARRWFPVLSEKRFIGFRSHIVSSSLKIVIIIGFRPKKSSWGIDVQEFWYLRYPYLRPLPTIKNNAKRQPVCPLAAISGIRPEWCGGWRWILSVEVLGGWSCMDVP